MLVYFFQWRLRPGLESQFQDAWAEVTRDLLAQGSHGSALFDGPDGTVCALARWPDRATRQAATARDDDARRRMHEAIAETLQTLPLDERLNLWAAFPLEDGPAGPPVSGEPG